MSGWLALAFLLQDPVGFASPLQERVPFAEVPRIQHQPVLGAELRPYAGLGFWRAEWDFDAQTPNLVAAIESSNATLLQVGVQSRVLPGIEGVVEFEFGFGNSFSVTQFLVGFGVVGDLPPLTRPPLTLYPPPTIDERPEHELEFGLGLVISRLDIQESAFPGSFDTGFGVEAWSEYERPMSDSISAWGRIGVRYVRYNFAPDDDVVSADDVLDGPSASITFGVEVRF